MSANKVPLPYRDSCAHLLIPLNNCRFDNFYLPWRCMVGHMRRGEAKLVLTLTIL